MRRPGSLSDERRYVASTQSSLRIIAARELGMTPVLRVALETLTDLEQLAAWHRERNLQGFRVARCRVDRYHVRCIVVSAGEFRNASGACRDFQGGDVSVIVVSVENLIAPKQAVGRPLIWPTSNT